MDSWVELCFVKLRRVRLVWVCSLMLGLRSVRRLCWGLFYLVRVCWGLAVKSGSVGLCSVALSFVLLCRLSYVQEGVAPLS